MTITISKVRTAARSLRALKKITVHGGYRYAPPSPVDPNTGVRQSSEWFSRLDGRGVPLQADWAAAREACTHIEEILNEFVEMYAEVVDKETADKLDAAMNSAGLQARTYGPQGW